MLCIVANMLYVFVDTHTDYLSLSWLNATFTAVSAAALLLLRYRHYTASKLTLFIGAYAVLFVFCAIEPASTGVSFFLILANLGAIAIFGREQRMYALALCILGAILFMIAIVWDVRLYDTQFSEEYIRNNFILNFFVFLILAVLILYFMLELNHYAEKTLEKKEAETREKNKELVKLNAELDRFVYSVSHDLRSPLASIAGLVYIGQHVENLDEAKQYFTMIGDRINAQDFFHSRDY